MKLLNLIAISFLSVAVLSSCSNDTSEEAGQQMDTLAANVENTIDDIGERLDNWGHSDTTILQAAILVNQKQLRMLEIGVQSGTHEKIKATAKGMIAEHQQMAQKMEAYAAKAGIEVKELVERELHDIQIGTENGGDWDREWLDRMEDMHNRHINKLDEAKGIAHDNDLKILITESVPKLREHLETIQKVRNEMHTK